MIDRAVELEDVEPLMQQRDERQEQLALQAAGIELVGRQVGGRHHHQPALEQLAEQPAEQHRVGDVGDLELVEAEQPGLLDQRAGERADRVAGLAPLAPAMERVVDLEHELVEMHPAFGRHRSAGEEQVHQHRLAAPDAAEEIEPRRRLGAPPRQPEALAPGTRRRRPVACQRVVQGLQLLDRDRLGRIHRQQPLLAPRTIGRERPGRRRIWRAPPLGTIGQGPPSCRGSAA